MRKPRFALITTLITIFAILVYLYRNQINSFLGAPYLANYLLLISIIVGVLPFLTDYFKYRSKKQLNHSEILIENALKKWLEKDSISIENGSLPIESTELGGIRYVNNKIVSANPKDPVHLKFFPEVKEHLVSGYPETWNLWIKSKELARDCNEKAEIALRHMENKIRKNMQNYDLIEWDERSREPERWFITAHAAWWLYNLSLGMKLPDIKFENGKYRCGGGLIYVASPVEDEVRHINQIIEGLSLRFTAEVEAIGRTKKATSEALEKFRNKINLIAKEFELGRPLKGKCRYC